tara:strand:- start:172 stop:1752 length:1581 start_codon:yes stop_codon:yes gene_type:complete
MLKVSNSMPIANYSQVVISDNSGATFKPKTNSRIRLNLPTTLGMIDFKSSYLQFETKVLPHSGLGTSNSYKYGWSNKQGSEQIVRDLIVRVGGKPLETITNYNVLDKVRKDYQNDMTLDNLHSIYNHATLKADNPSYETTAWDATTPTLNYNNVGQKQHMHLDLSGLLSSSSGFPIVSSGNVEVEIILEDQELVLSNQHTLLGCNGTDTTSAGDGSLTDLDISEANLGLMGWDNEDNPLVAGNVIKVVADDAGAVKTRYFNIVSNAKDGDGSKITINAPAGTYTNSGALTKIVIDVLQNVNDPASPTTAPTPVSNSLWDYQVENVEFVVRTIDMPPDYLSGIQRRIQSEGLVVDVPTYTMYLSNIQPNVGTQSLIVPCYSSRVRSVVSVPIKSGQPNYEYERKGAVDGLRNYQAKIGSRVEPQRPVDLTNWTTNVQHQYHSQEHIQEMTKALISTGIGERSLVNWRDNFVIGRSLSYNGSSEDLSDTGFRWEIQYNTNNNDAKLSYNFVNSIKRLQIVPTGVNIFG